MHEARFIHFTNESTHQLIQQVLLGLSTFFLSPFIIFRQGRSIVLSLHFLQIVFLHGAILLLDLNLLAFVLGIQDIQLLLLVNYIVLNLFDVDFVALNEFRLQYGTVIILRLLRDVHVILQQELRGEEHRAQHQETECYGIRHFCIWIQLIIGD